MVLAAAVVVTGLVIGLVDARAQDVLAALAAAVSVGVAVVVQAHRPAAAVAPALAWCGAAPLAVALVERYGQTAGTPTPLPAAVLVADAAVGLWPLNVAGLVALLLWHPRGAPVVSPPERIEVTISDEVGLTSTAPKPAAEAAPDIAPQIGEAAPPAPAAEPAPPVKAEAAPVPRPGWHRR